MDHSPHPDEAGSAPLSLQLAKLLEAPLNELMDEPVLELMVRQAELFPAVLDGRSDLPKAFLHALARKLAAHIQEDGSEARVEALGRIAARGALPADVRDEVLTPPLADFLKRRGGGTASGYAQAARSLEVLLEDHDALGDIDMGEALTRIEFPAHSLGPALRHPALDLRGWAHLEAYILDFASHDLLHQEMETIAAFPAAFNDTPDLEIAHFIADDSDKRPEIALRMYRKAAERLLTSPDRRVHAVLLSAPLASIRLHAVTHIGPSAGAPVEKRVRRRD